MFGRVLERLLDAQAGWAQPFGEWVHGLVAGIFGRMLPVRDFLAGTWLGHPLHALLTDVPIGALTLVIVLDILGQPAAADVALLIGVLSMLAAALAGYADYSTTDGKARVRATIHSTLMLIALVVYLVSLGIRLSGPTSRTLPIILSIVAYLILAGGAFVGGDVVYALGNVVDRHAWRPSGAKWQPLDVGEIAEGALVKARLGAQALVLLRSGDTIHALHDQCAHAGGPLSAGTIVDGCVECPWHGSRFEIATGTRRRGPTLYDQPSYEVRVAESGGYEARRVS
ncbi:MAG: Rieske 2Fe-2S domain-containing protein [Candidatus Limnocylindrales bacterium]